MAPLPRPEVPLLRDEQKPVNVPSGEEVVISGMAGKFPESNDVLSFMDHLYNKVDMVTADTRRWEMDHPEIPPGTGKLNEIEKFDAQYFGVHYKQAWNQDPMSRMLLESAYAAIIDAGVNPRLLRNTKTGVFIGSGPPEAEKMWVYEVVQLNGFGITGCCRAMFANRISFWLGTTGPSYTLDASCSSSMLALEHAYRAISTGQCDSAIVGGSNLCMHPYASMNYNRLGFLSPDSKTKVFDKNADGYARSESISVLFLQKAKDAKRIYAEVVHVKSIYNNDSLMEFEHHRSVPYMTSFLNQFYSEIDVLPKDVDYVEAFGIGRPKSDRDELEAIDQVFCKDRKKVLYVGSVKSNMGHSEAASGAVSATKVCLGYHTGKMAGNLHLSTPRDDVAGLREGRLRILTEDMPCGTYSALNSYSFTGVNVHALLKGFNKPKDTSLYKTDLPRLVLASGREESGTKKIFKDLKSKPLDAEQIRLLHSVFEADIPGHMNRGYTLLESNDKNETVSLDEVAEYCPGGKRPVWFVYSGMGSQWAGMGAQLMRIPIFAAAIHNCQKALESTGINLPQILTEPDPKIYENILNSFVGIAAVQIGLTDVLKAVGIEPDHIIGHSLGELGCAYADGCFSAEEMILAAYSRGLVSVQTPFIRGSMAAVGIGFRAVKALCPPDIFVACHNGPDSSTISGPAESMKAFVAELQKQYIFAKEVPCSNIAFHSKYIAAAGPGLLKYLKEVIKEPKLRSPRWVSTSVPQDRWEEHDAKWSSAEYHTNNLLKSVLFEETSRLIPANAITIEVAPHGLLQAILKRSLPEGCTNLPLTKRAHADNAQFLLSTIGKLYLAGLNPKVATLYPQVQFPVSTGTPMLSHQVEWQHAEDWSASRYTKAEMVSSGERMFVLSVHDDEYQFLKDHIRNGVNVLPETALLVMVWDTLKMIVNKIDKNLSVEFEDVRFEDSVSICHDRPIIISVMIQKATGRFEIIHEDATVTSGCITVRKQNGFEYRNLKTSTTDEEDKDQMMTSREIYKSFFLNGHSYRGQFQSIQEISPSGKNARIVWNNEWVTFLNSLIQMNMLRHNTGGVMSPRFIRKLRINLNLHGKAVGRNEIGQCMDAKIFDFYGTTRCGGVEMEGLVFASAPQVVREPAILEKYDFVPFFINSVTEVEKALSFHIQTVLENNTSKNLNVIEIVDDAQTISYSKLLKDIITRSNLIDCNVRVLNEDDASTDLSAVHKSLVAKSNLVIIYNLLGRKNIWRALYEKLSNDTFIISREPRSGNPSNKLFQVISSIPTTGESLILIKKRNPPLNTKYIYTNSNKDISWVGKVQKELQTCERLVIVSERDSLSGVMGLVKNIRRQSVGKAVHLLLLPNLNAPKFRPELPLFEEQLNKNLSINIYQGAQWGCYRYMPISAAPVMNSCIQLTSSEPGDLASLSWSEISLPSPEPGKIQVQVHYSAPTFHDMQKASNLTPSDEDNISKNTYGMDFSGVTSRGERVMGLLPTGALSSVVEADLGLLWPVPEHWTMEESATVPQAYAHALYCLAIKTAFVPGMRVLVHGGAGALGQAAIAICLAFGCHVLTTVSSVDKKRFLLELFPALKESDIGNSREPSFKDTVLNATKGLGCHMIISTVDGILRENTMTCTGAMGAMMDVTHTDNMLNKHFNMGFLTNERNYYSIAIPNIFQADSSEDKMRIHRLVASGIAKGWVRPLSRVVLPYQEAPRAFRLLAASRHRGRVLLRLCNEEPAAQRHQTPVKCNSEATTWSTYSSEGSYVVVCGKQELGIELADWLVQKGAKILLLSVHSDLTKGYFSAKQKSWQRNGVKVIVSFENLQTKEGCSAMLMNANNVAPIFGLYIVKDNNESLPLDINTTGSNFAQYADEAKFVQNLDAQTRSMCPNIQHFVVFTSLASSGSGSAMADSVVENICSERAQLGMPALALQLGPIVQFDETSEMTSKNEWTQLSPQPVSSVFKSMDSAIKLKLSIAASYTIAQQEKTIISQVTRIIGKGALNTMSETIQLGDQGVNWYTANEIRHLLEKEYRIIYPTHKVLEMTILDLQDLENKDSNELSDRIQKSQGLSNFYNYVDPDEFRATEPVYILPTLINETTEKEDFFDRQEAYLMMIPGMEGHHKVFETVCRRLKIRAVAYQLGVDYPTETLQDMAARMLKVMTRKLAPNAKFYLFAYSFGVSVALEVASLLENCGHDGTVFCLDGGPEAFIQVLDSRIGHLDEPHLQDAVVNHMYRLMAGTESKELQRELQNLDWQEKLDAAVKHLRSRVNFSICYKRSVVETAYTRIQQARTYVPHFKTLRAQLVLLRATKGIDALKDLPADYGLSKYSEKPVKVYDLDADHESAPRDLRCSNIVNRELDPHIIEVFKKRNLCKIYPKDTINYSV